MCGCESVRCIAPIQMRPPIHLPRSLDPCAHRVVSGALEVFYAYPSLLAALNTTSAWNYVMANTQDSFHEGYEWSLDHYTRYIWTELGMLKLFIAVLVALEVRTCLYAPGA